MSYPIIKTQIKTILETVSGIGIVHDYERLSVREEIFVNFFISNITLNGWMITRRSREEDREALGRYVLMNDFLIIGLYGLDDTNKSEDTFNDIIEKIAIAFRSKPKLNNTAQRHELIQGESIEPRMIDGKMVQYCVLG